MIKLREQDRKIICDLANKIFSGPVEIWAYGSRVKGTSHDASDLDLVLRSKNLKPIIIEEFSKFVEELKDSQIPILVQVFDWARLPESFHENILKEYEVLK